jgi:hypothetical protein
MTTEILCDAPPSGSLEINGVPLHTPAWTVIDVTRLWMGADIRGQDRILPTTPGVIPYRRRMTVTRYSLPMVIIGHVDMSGTPNTDIWEGLEYNIDFLRAWIVDPTNAGDGTLPASLTMPSGLVRTADVHVLGLNLGIVSRARMRATLEISLPQGVFA